MDVESKEEAPKEEAEAAAIEASAPATRRRRGA